MFPEIMEILNKQSFPLILFILTNGKRQDKDSFFSSAYDKLLTEGGRTHVCAGE
jgi:hypothetical protein